MRKLAAPFLFMPFIFGCVSTSNQEQNLAMQAALLQSEENINQRLSRLEASLSNQNDYIESLENEFVVLKDNIAIFTKANIQNTPPTQLDETPNDLEVLDSSANTPTTSLLMLGAIETVQIDSILQPIDARIDTGTETSSLNAIDIQEFERDGRKWVRFHLVDKNTNNDEKKWIEAPVVRYASIRQPSSDSVKKRAVVELWVKLGQIHEKAQFTLADRSQMSHSILLGREFIKDIAVVDVSKRYLQSKPENTIK